MNYFIATSIGFSIVISMVQNARLSQSISNAQTTVLNFMTGLFGILVIFVIGGFGFDAFTHFYSVPLFAYIGGILGVVVVFIATVVIRKVSIIGASMLMYTGQMLAGIVIDYFRDIYISPIKILGCILIIVGIYINAYIDYKAAK